MNRLLVIDDEPNIAAFVQDVAVPIGFDVRVVGEGKQFLAELQDFRPNVVVMDLQMPGIDGIELLETMGRQKSPAKVIVVSGMDAKVLATARRLGMEYGLSMAGVLQKPIMLNDLEGLLGACLTDTTAQPFAVEDIHEGLRSGQFELYYQPILNLSCDGQAEVAAEALLRWNNPEHGLVMPGQFFGLIEAGGLSQAVADYVLTRAIDQIAAWSSEGLSCRVSVNINPDLLDDVAFPERLLEMLRGSNVDPTSLKLEITERGAVERITQTMNVLTRLRLKGIDLAIDDFGTGNSSLIQLHRMPFSELKIDRSFIEDMSANADSKVIVRALIEMAHSLGMTVCAEGIETNATLNALIEFGCDRAQGFLFSKAICAREFGAWWNGDNNTLPGGQLKSALG